MFTAFASATLAAVMIGAAPVSTAAGSSSILAINILAVPDEAMRTTAQRLNERLRQNNPEGFALDASHVPHLSLVHEFVRTEDLPKLYSAIERVLTQHRLVERELTAHGLEHTPWNGKHMLSISVEKSVALSVLQDELVKVLRPYAADAGGPDAFRTTKDSPEINAATIDYVRTFFDKQTGPGFKPHIAVGLGDAAVDDKLQRSELRTPTKFKIAAVAVYHLGNDGTARTELWRWSP